MENDFLNNILVAFIFSNLTLKGVNLQKLGGVYFSNLTLNRWFFSAPANQNGEVCIKKRLRNLFECILTKSDA